MASFKLAKFDHACDKCDKAFKSAVALRMHKNRVHSRKFNKIMRQGLKKRKYKKKDTFTLQDAIVTLKVKRDSFQEVINILENLG